MIAVVVLVVAFVLVLVVEIVGVVVEVVLVVVAVVVVLVLVVKVAVAGDIVVVVILPVVDVADVVIVAKTSLTINRKLHSIKRLFYLPFNAKIQFFKSFILPYFYYGLSLAIYFHKDAIRKCVNFIIFV